MHIPGACDCITLHVERISMCDQVKALKWGNNSGVSRWLNLITGILKSEELFLPESEM